ncbi:hypothetical protein EZV73_05335 [Acidaminobacter sp. JC074]|uniref:hypothetical protein n=1 Tax=Acidaminobacter sp. JC074 TaxID=2530199 RepID=UPI001F0E3BE7|nr:hypothetical protein [Acidaminobacter sp. JC074]MCH4886979.1 hypothetical protein [Acidaminobacter sp. JC074]
MKKYYDYIVFKNDEAVDDYLCSRVLDPSRRDYGGFRDKFVDIKKTVYSFSYMAAAYVCPDSKYFKSPALKDAMSLSLDFFNRELRETQTIDFVMCNFSSAPDTAFCIEKLVPSFKLIDHEPSLKSVAHELYILIEKMTIGICKGGFHTPNHRWAISSALLQSSQINLDSKMVKVFTEAADKYLNEGIDCNEDGEYAERSSGNYNAVVNRALISLYEITGKKEYLEYIKRNLKMMLYYFDPDDTIFTDNSTRQDMGTKEFGLKYFFQYLYVSNEDELFSRAACKLIEGGIKRDEFPNFLVDILLRKHLLDHKLSSPEFILDYNKYFKESGVVRYRKNNLTYSLVKDKKHFLILKYKDMRLQVHIGVSLCHVRYFEIQEIVPKENGYELFFDAEGWYYRPFEQKQESSDWWKMDHEKRELLINNTFSMKVKIEHEEKTLTIHLDAGGYEHIPFRLEIGIPKYAMLENDQFTLEASSGNYMILKEGNIRIQGESCACKIGSGFFSHNYLGHPTNDPRQVDDFSLIMTGETASNKSISIEFEDNKWLY